MCIEHRSIFSCLEIQAKAGPVNGFNTYKKYPAP